MADRAPSPEPRRLNGHMPDPEPRQRIILVHGFTQTASSWETFAGCSRDRLPNASVRRRGSARARERRASSTPTCGRAPTSSCATAVGRRTSATRWADEWRCTPRSPIRSSSSGWSSIGATAGIDDDDERRGPPRGPTRRWRRGSKRSASRHSSTTGWPIRCSRGSRRRRHRVPTASATPRRAWPRASARPVRARRSRCGSGSATLDVPTLMLAGEHDAKFSELGRRLARHDSRRPRSSRSTGAGHSVHLERPAATADVIADWLSRQEPRIRPIEARRP